MIIIIIIITIIIPMATILIISIILNIDNKQIKLTQTKDTFSVQYGGHVTPLNALNQNNLFKNGLLDVRFWFFQT